MDLQRWKKIEDVFQSALDLSGGAREKFVRAECGDDAELRREVEKLIARYEAEESFLESPVWTDSILMQPSLKQQIAVSLEKEISPAPEEKQPFIGRQIGAFRLTEELGKGGMGVVYLAERADGEFRQRVAIKLIKRGMDSDFIVKRFRHERQIAATLNHPNIARLLDGGTTPDDLPYFVMEFVDGKPFFKYSETKQLDLRRKLELFLRVCQAISYAHGKQIIHRDIKPGNILVTGDGEPKLLDFGIAKILDPDLIHESVMPTATQMRLMTPEYASPEQVRGDEITPASDQYSLGVLLYELLTGARPYKFPSRSPHDIARIICEEIPSEPSSGEFGKMLSGDLILDKDFCRKLDRIVLKALRKNPSERYASVKEFADDIERFLRNEPVRAESFAGEKELPETARKSAASSPTGNQKSIAVLPFKILNEVSGEDTNGSKFLGIGLADAMITRLSNVRQFVVRPTSSVLRYGAIEADSFQAGEELNVEFVLDGNVIKTETRIRVSVQLLKVGDRSMVWAERFDEDFTDVLELEDQISMRVAESIVPQLTTGEIKNLAKRGTDDAKAYEAYLRGRYHWNTFTETSFAQAFVAYHEAIAHDPDYALAHAGIADYYIWLGIFGVLPPNETYQPAKLAALRAIEIDDKLPEAHAALGFTRLCGNYDWEASERDIRRALFLNPNYAVAHNWLAILLMTAARFDEGLEHARRAVELDPLTYQNYRTLSTGFYFARRYAESLAETDRTIEKFPLHGVVHASRSWSLRALGRTAEAVESSRKAVAVANGATYVSFNLAQSLAADGRREEALETVRRIEANDKVQYVSDYQIAVVYCYLMETEKALDALEAALADGEGWLVWLAVEPALDALRDEPRFIEVLRRVQASKTSAQIVSASNKIFTAETVLMPTTEIIVSPRRVGIKQGVFLIIVSFLLLPVLVVLVAAFDSLSPVHLILTFLLVFGGGLIRITYALFFEPKHAPSQFGNSSTNLDVSFASRQTAVSQSGQTGAANSIQTAESKSFFPKSLKYAAATSLLCAVSFVLYQIAAHTTLDLSDTPPNERWKIAFASVMNVKRLTTSGTAVTSAVSPDGRQIAFSSREGELQGLWIQDTDSGNPRQLVAPGAEHYVGVTFSPDGKFVYYDTYNPLDGNWLLSRSAANGGGAARKILENVYRSVGFAPDGGRIVYYSLDKKTSTINLLVAETDEDGAVRSPKLLAARALPSHFVGNPTFSLNGREVIYAAADVSGEKELTNLFVFNFDTESERKLDTPNFNEITAVAWRESEAEIVVSGNLKNTEPLQLWLVSYPSGETTRLTNDLNNYHGVSLTNDSRTLVASKKNLNSNLQIVDLTGAKTGAETSAKQITGGVDRRDGIKGVDWAADGRIFYIANAETEKAINIINADGSGQQTLNIPDAAPANPVLTADGRYLFFIDERGQEATLKRRESATGAITQITSGLTTTPVLTPDSRFLIYSALNESRKTSLHRVSIEGGEAAELTSASTYRPAVSPDGRFIACFYNTSLMSGNWELAVLSINGGVPTTIIKPADTVSLLNPHERRLEWSPDSRSIYYVNDRGGVSNIFRVAADGSNKTEQTTHFKSGRIFDFSLSPDGKRAVLARGSTSSDAVIFRNNK